MDQDFIIERKIIKIGSHMLNTRSEDLKKFNLTSNQSDSLLFFAQNEGALALNLKDHLKISHQAARNIVERMKAKDLLYIKVSPVDGRARQVFLTPKGKQLYEKLQKGGANLGKNVMSRLSEQEKEQLSGILDKILETL